MGLFPKGETAMQRQQPNGTIRYKAIYSDPQQSPFCARPTVPTKTVDIDAAIARAEVERMAREAAEGYEFIRLEVVDS